jgi:hypothetical protein
MDNKVIVKNKVRDVAEKRGLDRSSFIGLCLQHRRILEGKRLTADTAGRAYDGETTLSMTTAALIASALGVDLSELFEIK